jgi:hypothetical protein
MFARCLAGLLSLFALVAGAVVLSALSDTGLAPSDRPDGSDPPRFFGWINDPDAVLECVAEMGCRAFRETEAFAADDDDGEDVYLWESARRVNGEVLPARNQKSVGSCVGFAIASAIEHLSCVQIDGGCAGVYRDLAAEVIYGGSRVEIGGGRIRGDGSIGAWGARWVKEYGAVPRGVHGPHDLREYSEARCREYGRRGVPDDLETLAKRHPVRGVARVTSWRECRAAIRNGYPVVVCSNRGFEMERDEDGFCNPRGTWYHAMAVIGIRGGSRPGGFLLNSWGEGAHRGPRNPKDAPAAGFWADADVLDRMLAQGDSWAFSLFEGFPAAVTNRSEVRNQRSVRPNVLLTSDF